MRFWRQPIFLRRLHRPWQKYRTIRKSYARSSWSADQKDRLSRAIHAASIVARYPEEDLFQRFLSLEPSDLRVDLYYPALPKPRSDQMLMIEVLVSSGTDTDRKKGLVVALVEKLGEAGIDPNDIIVFFLENRSCERIIRRRRVRTTCCPRLINECPYPSWPASRLT
jgi:hypothetical protein